MGCTNDQGNACSKDELPVHEVTLSAFYLMKTEVSQGLWSVVMGENPAKNRRADHFPVEQVSFEEVEVFIQRLNELSGKSYRLPTEAEWEYAARGGARQHNYVYSGGNDAGELAWHAGNSYEKSHASALKQANALGLYDMSGNVWEWCSDWYGTYQAVVQSDPRGPSSGTERIVRGGSWAGSASFCRVALRYHYPENYKTPFIGFRLALSS